MLPFLVILFEECGRLGESDLRLGIFDFLVTFFNFILLLLFSRNALETLTTRMCILIPETKSPGLIHKARHWAFAIYAHVPFRYILSVNGLAQSCQPSWITNIRPCG